MFSKRYVGPACKHTSDLWFRTNSKVITTDEKDKSITRDDRFITKKKDTKEKLHPKM